MGGVAEVGAGARSGHKSVGWMSLLGDATEYLHACVGCFVVLRRAGECGQLRGCFRGCRRAGVSGSREKQSC